MALNIFWTGNAKRQLKNIFEYYKENASLELASKLTKSLVKRTLLLKAHPEIGVSEPLLKSYKIIYWVNKKKSRIDISDVFDARQNPIKLKK